MPSTMPFLSNSTDCLMSKQCLSCSKPIGSAAKKYCSVRCQKQLEYISYIKQWKSGDKPGVRGKNTFNFSQHVVRYVWEKYASKCARCGWHEENPATKKSPLEIDHIDGNSENNTEENLILLCPNCHALTTTHKNHNFGKGRGWRRKKYAIIDEAPL